MNIALITDAFYPSKGGVAHHLNSLCKIFKNKRHKLYVFNPYYESEDIFNNLSINIKELKVNKLFFYFLIVSMYKLIRTKEIPLDHKLSILLQIFTNPINFFSDIQNIVNIYPYIKKYNIDIIIGGYASSVLSLIFLLSRISNKKVISFTYGNDFLIKNDIREKFFHVKTKYFKNIDKIIVLGKTTKFFVQKIHHLNEDKIEIFPLAIFPEDYTVNESKEELRKKYNISKDTFVILSVGWHIPRKRFDLVIRAVKNIKEKHPNININFFLIGQGILTQYLKDLTKSFNLEDHIKFFGECENNIRNELYKLSDLFIMTSITEENSIEGFGLVFLEANYFKVPVIGSYSGGILDAIVNDKSGLLVKPNNLEDLIEKILYLYDNKNKRIEMGEYGYNRVINEFLWEKRYHDFINILNNVNKK